MKLCAPLNGQGIPGTNGKTALTMACSGHSIREMMQNGQWKSARSLDGYILTLNVKHSGTAKLRAQMREKAGGELP